jgi:hypothetical protein
MRKRTRVLVLASSILATASFLRAQCANTPQTGGMLGPNAPILLDTDGNGPTGCDGTIIPLYDSQTDRITVPNPFQDCDESGGMHNEFNLLRDQDGTPIQLFRDRDVETEILTPTGFFAPNQPMSGHLLIQKFGSTVQEGDGHLVMGGGGFFTGVEGGQTFGGDTSAAMSLVYGGTGPGGGPAYVSLPWSQLAGLGLLNHVSTNCPADVPQVFIPLSHGRIVLDLDGDGIPDPGFFSSPPLTAEAASGNGIPAVSRGTMALLAAALAGAALFQLRRGGLGF